MFLWVDVVVVIGVVVSIVMLLCRHLLSSVCRNAGLNVSMP